MKLTNLVPISLFVIFMSFLGFKHHYNNNLPEKSNVFVNLDNLQSIYGEKLKVPSSKYLIHVISSWCNTCKAHHKNFNKMVKKANIPVVGLIFQDTEENIKAMIKSEGNPYFDIALLDEKHIVNLGISGVPETLVVDENGASLLRIKGNVTNKIFANDIYPKFKEN